ncbi:hypothetical protein [Lutimonas zeaxanthinifaciens]|uniref:hypothetical protein n=1 Tax=Lutimonas zeaxanthinifaciens TaxID=3060215 RepID=UPI00265D1B61|nr:hypothetical protein [Lutimonas sp. YSD2104]WKK66686.1 hypothetical protein QZH61_03485 [Lutimonas sp. YSD2104]
MSTRYSIIIFWAFCLPLLVYGQGYYNQENFGNRSLLLSGNVTGSVDDLGLTYYNPSRIALIEDPVFTINAKAYQISSLDLSNVFGRDSKLSDSRFEGVPSLIAGTFDIEKWDKHKFAYSFLSKQRFRLNFNVSQEVDPEMIDNEDIDRLVGNFHLDNKETDEWFGLTWGMKIKDNFSVGISTFVSVYNVSGLYDVRFSSLSGLSDVDIFNNEISYSQRSYGIFWKLGLAWTLNKFDLGVNVDLPYLEVISGGKFRYQNYLSGIGENEDEFAFYDFRDLDAKRKEPLGISFGVGVPLGKNKLHFKADWHGGLSEYDRLVIPPAEDGGTGFSFSEELRSVINFGLGGEFYLNEKLNIYGSFSTDFSPVKSRSNAFDIIDEEERDATFDEDFFHYGLGVDIKLKKMKVVLGSTYSRASGDFSDPVELPSGQPQVAGADDASRISVSRWRFIVGLEIPIFGYDLEFK